MKFVFSSFGLSLFSSLLLAADPTHLSDLPVYYSEILQNLDDQKARLETYDFEKPMKILNLATEKTRGLFLTGLPRGSAVEKEIQRMEIDVSLSMLLNEALGQYGRKSLGEILAWNPQFAKMEGSTFSSKNNVFYGLLIDAETPNPYAEATEDLFRQMIEEIQTGWQEVPSHSGKYLKLEKTKPNFFLSRGGLYAQLIEKLFEKVRLKAIVDDIRDGRLKKNDPERCYDFVTVYVLRDREEDFFARSGFMRLTPSRKRKLLNPASDEILSQEARRRTP